MDAALEVGEQQPEVVRSPTPKPTSQTQVDTVATHLGEVVSDGADRGAAAERPQLHGSAGDSARRQPGHHSDADLGDHGRRHRNHQSLRRLESRRRFDRRPARIGQRVHGERRRRAGAHERRNFGDPQPGFHPGISRSHQQFRSRIRQLQRRDDQRRHQVRQQRLPRRRVRVPAQHGSGCQELLRQHARRLPAESVRRHRRRADQEGQAVLLPRLSGNPHRARHHFARNLRAFACRSAPATSATSRAL